MEASKARSFLRCFLLLSVVSVAYSAARPQKGCSAHLLQVTCVPKGTKIDLSVWFARHNTSPSKIMGTLQGFIRSGAYPKSDTTAMKQCFGSVRRQAKCKVMKTMDCSRSKPCQSEQSSPPAKNFCLPRNPCMNDGRCFTTATQVVCQCSNGYYGNKCQYGSLTKPQFDAALQMAMRLITGQAKIFQRQVHSTITKAVAGKMVGGELKSSIEQLMLQHRSFGNTLQSAITSFSSNLPSMKTWLTKGMCPYVKKKKKKKSSLRNGLYVSHNQLCAASRSYAISLP